MFLDTDRYPEIYFASTKVSVMADHTLRIDGELTPHGITKPIVFRAKLNKKGPNPFDKRTYGGLQCEWVFEAQRIWHHQFDTANWG
jgi:polyisoprenoid-binding protein YceI